MTDPPLGVLLWQLCEAVGMLGGNSVTGRQGCGVYQGKYTAGGWYRTVGPLSIIEEPADRSLIAHLRGATTNAQRGLQKQPQSLRESWKDSTRARLAHTLPPCSEMSGGQ